MREPGIYDSIPEAEYHSDPDSLSVTGAKVLLKAPALYLHQRTHPVRKDVFDVGSAAHKLVLGVGDPIVVLDADSWRGKEAAEFKETAYAAGEIPLLAKDHQRVTEMADALSSHTLAMRLLGEGRPEVSAFCTDEDTGVMRRARFDWLSERVLTDYKTTICAEPEAIRKSVANFGYHQQAAWYVDIAGDLGHPAEAFAFVFQEKTAPYLVSVVDLDERALDRGRELNHRALRMFRDCTESGIWPGYLPDTGHTTISLPPWAFYDSEESA